MRRLGRRLVENLLEEGHDRGKDPGRLLRVRGQQLLGELGHEGRPPVLGWTPVGSGRHDAVVLHHEAVEAFERIALLGHLFSELLGRRLHRLLEEGQQQLVLAAEVLVEAAQRLAGALDDLLDGEFLARTGVQELDGGVEKALDPGSRLECGPSRATEPPPARANCRPSDSEFVARRLGLLSPGKDYPTPPTALPGPDAAATGRAAWPADGAGSDRRLDQHVDAGRAAVGHPRLAPHLDRERDVDQGVAEPQQVLGVIGQRASSNWSR